MEIDPQVQEKLDQLAKLPAAARGGIAVCIGVLILAGYWFFMYQDTALELERLHGKELELQRKLSEVRSIAANLDEFEQEIGGLQLKLKAVLRQLPNQREIEVLLTDISNLGKTSGIEITEFRRRPEVVNGFYAEAPVELALKGTYHNIAQFFDMLAGLPRIVNMGSINVKVGSDSMESTVLHVKGTATTFRFIGKEKA